MKKNYDRRKFLGRLIAGSSMLALPQLTVSAPRILKPAKKIRLQKDDVILFTGDSITDSSRVRDLYKSPNVPRALGSGYVMLTASKIYRQHPGLNLKMHNTGINGDTIVKLLARWQTDCLDLKPTVLSILVGVNDFNVSFMETGKGNPQLYYDEFKTLLQQTTQALPGVRLVIGEPCAFEGSREKIDKWFPMINEYGVIARKIATEFDAVFIPYHEIFQKAGKSVPPSYYTKDGIHPSLAGIDLMSEAWCNIIDK